MARTLLISLVSCLFTVNQARIVHCCDLAKLLYKEDMNGLQGYSVSDWLCLALVESKFNTSKISENADGSFDYGISQINSHCWCNDYPSCSENLCHVDCLELLEPKLLSSIKCVKRILFEEGGLKNWIQWKLPCSEPRASVKRTQVPGCHLQMKRATQKKFLYL
ncbi:PREDICTED: lysozyme-like protein 6-like [Elephantulus edwardii]|uniref:lysozyme-like protein 6-like n=1 Tax=Elephantulus edwardii TaxID=28737 RepID=UPI0003F06683|nr:PREDICTED: lysozyme-like protein 6-like [Elephantulus edwardii]